MQTIDKMELIQKNVLELLARAPLFQGLEPGQLANVLMKAHAVRFERGETLVKQGKPSRRIFLLMEGSVTVFQERPNGGRVILTHVEPPGTIGEIGLLLEQERSATVVADVTTTGLAIEHEEFLEMFQTVPLFGLCITRNLARRVDQLSGRVPLGSVVKDEAPREDAAQLLPLSFIEKYRVLPLSCDDNRLLLGCLERPTMTMLEALHNLLPGKEIKPVRIPIQRYDEFLQAATV
ncbi:MAG: cyclic nucleotide-binding domain-containing protein [Acidobacteriota bacterium]|nr:cyclic nucleotide-binding domain-containing protein [Acidobacteriota bacterium]